MIDKQKYFEQLKKKYQANQYVETSSNSPLYPILEKLEDGQILNNNEINWLKENNFSETISIAEFIALKVKYKATIDEDLSITSHLYKVLKKIDSSIPLSESELNFLKKNLTETFKLALDTFAKYLVSKIKVGVELTQEELNWIEKYQKQDVINKGKTKRFQKLKKIYSKFLDNDPKGQLYSILQKLVENQRLDAVDIAYLQGKYLFDSSSKIYIDFNAIEAQFYEADYQKTGNKWNLPNISSHWRKANQPQKALKATEDVNFDSIKENKLKSAILTTRGGAFRDLSQLDDAEKCAKEAIKYQPNSHHPYTLMGAICFDRYDRYEGEKWFREAEERGASRQSIDAEIKKSLQKMKNQEKRKEMAISLVKKDARRYAWAKKYLSKNIHKKSS